MRILFIALAALALAWPVPAHAQSREACSIVTSADVLSIFANLGLSITGGEAGIQEGGGEGGFVGCDRQISTPGGIVRLNLMYISDSGVADGRFNGWRTAREVYDHLLKQAKINSALEAHPEIAATAYYLEHRSGSQEREVMFLKDNAVFTIKTPNYGYVPKSVVLAAASVAAGVTPHAAATPSSSHHSDFIEDNKTAFMIAGGVAAVIAILIVFALARSRRANSPSPALATGLTDSAMENLESAKALFDQGAISKSEFERLKAKALGTAPSAVRRSAGGGAFSDSGMEQLENAKALLDQGIISSSEYERLKAKVLNG